MKRLSFSILLSLIAATPALGWDLVLPDSVVAQGPEITIGEVAQGSIPTRIKDVLIQTQRRPGTVESISRRTILRTLVSQGLAAGLRFRGAEVCRIYAHGEEVPATQMAQEIQAALNRLIPPALPGAPASWLEFQIPDLPVHLLGNPVITAHPAQTLNPGRNQVRVTLQTGDRSQDIPIAVVLHCFAETARAKRAIVRDFELTEDLFTWQWSDLAAEKGDPALNRNAVLGSSSTRALAAGDQLKEADVKMTPVVRIGDAVDLMIHRGEVSATVRAYARQAGCLGQTIPVRNELTGRLVNARVAGPGLVEWRQ